MIDDAQLLERFRLLSRDIQNGLQIIESHVAPLKPQISGAVFGQIETSLNNVRDAWGDFSSWVLISTLEDLNEARNNCAPAKINIASKINRSKKRRQQMLNSKALNVNTSDLPPNILIETYIPYFEQIIDIVLENSIKYAIRNSEITIAANRDFSKKCCKITISSLGPHVNSQEILQLGNKGFRAENARKLQVTGEGYGLYNAKRIIELLEGSIKFTSSQKITNLNHVKYSTFTINMIVPDYSESQS